MLKKASELRHSGREMTKMMSEMASVLGEVEGDDEDAEHVRILMDSYVKVIRNGVAAILATLANMPIDHAGMVELPDVDVYNATWGWLLYLAGYVDGDTRCDILASKLAMDEVSRGVMLATVQY